MVMEELNEKLVQKRRLENTNKAQIGLFILILTLWEIGKITLMSFYFLVHQKFLNCYITILPLISYGRIYLFLFKTLQLFLAQC